MDKSLMFFFPRVGSKRRLREKISRLMPKDFKTYVEPFVGSGSVMLHHKFSPDQKIVINDLDKSLIRGWRILKKGASGDPKKYDTSDINKLTQLFNSKGGGDMDVLVRELLKRNTFGSRGKGKIYKDTSPYKKLLGLPDYKAKLKNATILSQDYLSVISKYDSPSAFFYLDPPYEDSKEDNVYDATDKGGNLNFEKMAEKLRSIKGKFLLSMNDSASVRKTFKGFKIRGFTLGAQGRIEGGIGSKARKEVFITNY